MIEKAAVYRSMGGVQSRSTRGSDLHWELEVGASKHASADSQLVSPCVPTGAGPAVRARPVGRACAGVGAELYAECAMRVSVCEVRAVRISKLKSKRGG